MNVKQENREGRFDWIIWLLDLLLLIIGFCANIYFIKIPLPLRLVGWLVLVCIIFAITLQTVKGKQVWKFFREARNEMRKVVWPSRQQTFQTTLLVIAMVGVFAVLIWGLDSVIMWLITLITG
jgi:preprotein translocase subunit SecE